jgi:Glycosyl transferase family 11
MITLFDSFGNHSNRLFQNLHFEAFCLEHQIHFANPAFQNMRDYYIAPVHGEKDWVSAFLAVRCNKIFKQIKPSRNVVVFGDASDSAVESAEDIANQSNLLQLVTQYETIYVAGWGFKAHQLTEKHRAELVKRYALKPECYGNSPWLSRLQQWRAEGSVIVGVHIRRGDYKQWRGGQYYFSDAVYQRYMLDLKRQIAARDDRRCRFIVFSNEVTGFSDNDTVCVSQASWYVDHFLMSQCDWLIGPPSSFTLWASYMGAVPYYHMATADRTLQLDEFKICQG